MDAALAGTDAKAAETANRQLKRIFCIVPPGVVGDEANVNKGMRTKPVVKLLLDLSKAEREKD